MPFCLQTLKMPFSFVLACGILNYNILYCSTVLEIPPVFNMLYETYL